MRKTDLFTARLSEVEKSTDIPRTLILSLAQFVKDYIDDEDAADGFVFNRWYADTVRAGIPIPWEDLL